MTSVFSAPFYRRVAELVILRGPALLMDLFDVSLHLPFPLNLALRELAKQLKSGVVTCAKKVNFFLYNNGFELLSRLE